ncbi:hypothetical protein HMPREF3189_00926 [Clostridiales bacterium KA00134]|nr:hypothetical protein HMPREF3189_00926 [Clostridiales bacterium KA00134]
MILIKEICFSYLFFLYIFKTYKFGHAIMLQNYLKTSIIIFQFLIFCISSYYKSNIKIKVRFEMLLF